jgi:O-antigen/teichoic acid export membrane protein
MVSGVFILPFSLRMFPSEEMGIWQIFLQFITITTLLDFGFSSSFSRNVTYVFSGAKEFRKAGIETATGEEVDYGLLKSLLRATRFLYGVLALVFLLLFTVGGSLYLHSILIAKSYSGNATDVWVAWLLLGAALAYELYTYYYYAMLTGRGKVQTTQKIIVVSHTVRILVTIALLLADLKLLALVLGILVSDLVSRTLANRAFYNKEIKSQLAVAMPTVSIKRTLRILAPNSFKVGVVSLGVFLRQKAILLIAPYFLPLPVIASFGVSKQIVDMIMGVGNAWWGTFYPQATQYSVQNRKDDLKRQYIKAIGAAILTFAVLGAAFVLIGDEVLTFFKSQTLLLNGYCLVALLLVAFLDLNQAISSGFLLVRNEAPFYKSNLVAGALTVLFLWLMLQFTSLGVWSLILSSGLAMSLHLFWKWPLVVIRNLQVRPQDIVEVVRELGRAANEKRHK